MDAGAAELAAGLRAAPGLWLVDLRHNNISDRGATALAECLAAPGTGSSAGGISGGYAAAASAAAARSRRSSAGPALCASLRELVLSNNVIGDEGVLVLAEALAISSAARRVRIGNNPAGPASLRELAAAHKSRGLRRSRSRLSNASLNQPVQQLMAPPAQPGLDLGVVGRMAGAGTKSPSPGLFGALDMAGGAAESGDEEGGLSRLRVRTQGDAANAGVPHTSAHPLSPKHHPLLHQDPELGRLCALVGAFIQASLAGPAGPCSCLAVPAQLYMACSHIPAHCISLLLLLSFPSLPCQVHVSRPPCARRCACLHSRHCLLSWMWHLQWGRP